MLDAETEIFNEREDLFLEKNVIFFLTRCATTPCPCSYRSLQQAKKQFSEVNTTYKIYRFTKVTPLLVTKIPLSPCVLRTKLDRIRHVNC